MMSGVEPQITIGDQIHYQRFRYGNENRTGKRHSTDYTMTVRLKNVPAGSSLKIFCVNCNGDSHPHPNTLSGSQCVAGVYCHPPFSSFIKTQDIQIPWLQITRTVKKEMLSEMEKRQELLPLEFQSQGRAVLDQLKQEKNTIKSTQICLCVHLSGSVPPGHPFNIFQVSKPIKHVDKGKCLMIDELSHNSGSVLGQLVTHIFTSENSPPIDEGMVDVRMEETDEEGNRVWSSEPFVAGKEDIKYKHVIRYPVPEFRDKTVTEPVNVSLILRCLSSQKEESIPFIYEPNPDAVILGRKRKASWSLPSLERPAQKFLRTDQDDIKRQLQGKLMQRRDGPSAGPLSTPENSDQGGDRWSQDSTEGEAMDAGPGLVKPPGCYVEWNQPEPRLHQTQDYSSGAENGRARGQYQDFPMISSGESSHQPEIGSMGKHSVQQQHIPTLTEGQAQEFQGQDFFEPAFGAAVGQENGDPSALAQGHQFQMYRDKELAQNSPHHAQDILQVTSDIDNGRGAQESDLLPARLGKTEVMSDNIKQGPAQDFVRVKLRRDSPVTDFSRSFIAMPSPSETKTTQDGVSSRSFIAMPSPSETKTTEDGMKQQGEPAAAFDSVSSLNQTDMDNGLPNGSNSGKQASENIVMSNATIAMTSPCEVTSQMSCKQTIVYQRCVNKLEIMKKHREPEDACASVSNMNQTDNENENESQNGSNPGTQSSESAVMSNNRECKREESLTEDAPGSQQNFNLPSLPSLPSAYIPDSLESVDLVNFIDPNIFLPETDNS